MRLQSRLALAVAASAALAIFVTASAFWLIATREQRSVVDEGLIEAANAPRTIVEDVRRVRNEETGREGRQPFGQILEALPSDDRVFVRLRVVDGRGEVLVDDGLPAVDETALPLLETIEIDGERFRMAAAQTGPNDRIIVQVGRNMEDVEAGLARLRNRIVLGSLLGVGLAGLLGAMVAQRITAPILAVTDAAKSMARRQDLPSRIEVTRSDEIGELATSFNQMLSALEVSRDQQRRLVADASHELRTPLTSLRLKIDLLDSTPDLPADQRELLLAGSAAELESLSDLVAELVGLASDPTTTDEPPTDVQLGVLAREVAQIMHQRDGREIDVEVADDDPVSIRPSMVRRAMTNLVGNAVKYGPDGARILIRVDGGKVEVHDVGGGIADEDLPHIFDRFFRSPTARTQPGNGIGLAIVARVADLHGGRTWARNRPASTNDPGGAVVGFSVN